MEPAFALRAYVGTVRYAFSRSRRVVANPHADLIEAYDGTGQLAPIDRRPISFEPGFANSAYLGEPVAGSDLDLRFGTLIWS